MDLIPVLTTVILIAIIAVCLLALFTYAIFKLREQRSPERIRNKMEKRKFFKKFVMKA